MKKNKNLLSFAMIVCIAKLTIAQINVNSSGYVSLYSTLGAVQPVQSFGNMIFSTVNSGTNSAAFIRASNGYSTATAPDYTWWYNDQCGMYHPSNNAISFAIAGIQTLSLVPDEINAYCTSYGPGFTSNLTNTSGTTLAVYCSASGYNKYTFYVYGAGYAWAYQYNTLSDITLKENIKTIPDALSKVLKLRGVTYTYISQKSNDSDNSSKTQMGLIAQEVEKVIPEVVNTGKDGLKGVAYQNLVGLLVEAIKLQNSRIDSLQTQINNCCSISSQPAGINGTNNTSSNQAILYQNIPNPFNKTTTVTCFIPEQSGSASLLIMDMTGGLKTTIPITGKNSQTITINGGALSAGMYYYTLLVDGKEIDTKKMILTQ